MNVSYKLGLQGLYEKDRENRIYSRTLRAVGCREDSSDNEHVWRRHLHHGGWSIGGGETGIVHGHRYSYICMNVYSFK